MNKSIVLAGVFAILSVGCASRINYNDTNYEVVCQGQDAKGGYKVAVYMSNWDETLAIQQAKERLFDRIETTDFEDRIYCFHDEMIQEIWNESEAPILEKIKVQSEKM